MTLLIVFLALVIGVIVGGAWIAGRRSGGAAKREPHPHSPDYYQAIEDLEELKRGSRWGDIPDEGPLQ